MSSGSSNPNLLRKGQVMETICITMSQEDKDRLLKILVENDMTADRAVGYIPFNNITIYKVLYFRAVIPRTHIVQSVTVGV